MYFIFYTCRGLKLPALTNAVKATSARLRSASRKKDGGEEGMVVQKPEEDHKPLIIRRQGPVEGTPEKLIVDIETLSFRPASGQQLQTARRGKPFKPGNLCGRGGGRGVMKYKPTFKDSSLDVDNILEKGDDDIIVDEQTTYNEWLAAQGLVGLSEDQPSKGEIRKLHDKGDKLESDYDKNIEAETEVASKENVKDDSNNEKVEKDKGTPVKCKEIMKTPTYVNTKMKLMKARQIISKRKKKGNVNVHSMPQKEQKQSEGDESDLSEMSSLRMQVESMIKQGKTDADSIHKINTLKSILTMLDKPEDKCKTDEKHETKRKLSEIDQDLKHDEQINSDLSKGEEKSSDLKADEESKQDEKINSDLTQDEKLSGEYIKTENVILKIQVDETYSSDESTNDLTVKEKTNTLNENVELEKQKKKVSIIETASSIETMAQLDESLHDIDTDDTSCVETLVIDDNQVLDYSLPVGDTGQDIEKVVAGVVGDLLDNVLAEIEAGGEELSCTPPCSQIPREDPYTRRREVKEDSPDTR